jgi:hypothetical protein
MIDKNQLIKDINTALEQFPAIEHADFSYKTIPLLSPAFEAAHGGNVYNRVLTITLTYATTKEL